MDQQPRDGFPQGNLASTQVQQPHTQYIPVPIMQTQPQRQGQQLNNLYKTALCKHFTQHKHCVKGNGCHFAHGEIELRRKDEQLPIEVQYKMLNIPYNNYKTQVCKYFEQEKQCHFGKNCTYAHGKEELRKPYEELPQDLNQGLEITNPNAFRLLKAQVQALHPSFILNDKDQHVKNQILEISNLFRAQRDEQGMQVLQALLQNNQISGQFQASSAQMASAQAQQPQAAQFGNVSPQGSGSANNQTQSVGGTTRDGILSLFGAKQPANLSPSVHAMPARIPIPQQNSFVQSPQPGLNSQMPVPMQQTGQSFINGAPAPSQNAAATVMLTQQQLMEIQASNPQLFAAAMNPGQFVLNSSSLATQQQPLSQDMSAQLAPQLQFSLGAGPHQPQQQQAQHSIFAGDNHGQMPHRQFNGPHGVQNGAFGNGFLYTPLPEEYSAADNAHWSMQQQ